MIQVGFRFGPGFYYRIGTDSRLEAFVHVIICILSESLFNDSSELFQSDVVETARIDRTREILDELVARIVHLLDDGVTYFVRVFQFAGRIEDRFDVEIAFVELP